MRCIDDKDYTECLIGSYKLHYQRWKKRMLVEIENIAGDLKVGLSIDAVMEKYRLSRRDVALLVRLKYFTAEEAKCYNLEEIDRSVPDL